MAQTQSSCGRGQSIVDPADRWLDTSQLETAVGRRCNRPLLSTREQLYYYNVCHVSNINSDCWTRIGFIHGLDWIGSRSRYFNVILIVMALSDCQCVQIFRLSFDVNCCITNGLSTFITSWHSRHWLHASVQNAEQIYVCIIVKYCFRRRGFDGLDWMWVGTWTHIVDRIGLGQWVCELDLPKWTHVQRVTGCAASLISWPHIQWHGQPVATSLNLTVFVSVSSSLQITNRSFTYASPYLWNQLPSSFRQPHSVHCPTGSPHPTHITLSQSPPSLLSPIAASTCHSRLKTHLFHKSFPP